MGRKCETVPVDQGKRIQKNMNFRRFALLSNTNSRSGVKVDLETSFS